MSGFYPFGGLPVGGPTAPPSAQVVLDALEAVESAMSQLAAAINALVNPTP